MDKRVAEFIRETAQTLVGVDLALYLQANPKTFDTAAGLALRLRHPVAAIQPVVERLTKCGILRRVRATDGHHECYFLNSAPHIWNLLCLLTECYIDNPETRKQIIRLLMEQMHHGPEPKVNG